MLYRNILLSPSSGVWLSLLVKDHHMGQASVQSLFSVSCMQLFPKRMRSRGLWQGLEHMESGEGEGLPPHSHRGATVLAGCRPSTVALTHALAHSSSPIALKEAQ